MDNLEPDFDNSPDIAIIGMSGRFPGATNVDTFWQNLRRGVESITYFSRDELLAEGIDQAFLDNPNYVRAAPVIEDVDRFDADFFGYTPNEAESTDPQHRIFLECAWECLEYAGYDPYKYEGLIAVYAGAAMNTYSLFGGTSSAIVSDYVSTRVACDKDFLATRVSYKLDLKGPSMTVQTSCSTSLVAVHLACQSLLDAECDMALAGGVSIQVPHRAGYLYEPDGIFSPDGHCRTFDAQAGGTNFGNGAGIVLLKRLGDAINDGDTIHAIIKGTAINNDGASKVGYTAPSVSGQAAVIAEAMANADIEPDSVSYVEAHGTGTLLGDPIEVAALEKAFRSGTDSKQFCAIGSVKTNIGHLDTAAGIAGLIKTVLALKHKHLPPSLHFTAPNPKIDFENSPFYVNDTYRQWHAGNHPRRAGVTSLGVGGTNAHVILEEAPEAPTPPVCPDRQILTVSARSESAARAMSLNLAEHLRQHPDTNLGNAAYTLQLGRKQFPYRTFAVCDTAQAGIESLRQACTMVRRCDRDARPVVFMFPGQGAQYPGMAASLYAHHPGFSKQVDLLCGHLEKLIDIDLKALLIGTAAEEHTDQLHETWLAQPALFVVEYALARLWMSWGVQPEAMIGHSIGEYVCATIAGVMSVGQALEIVVERGRLMQQAPTGRMLAINLPAEELMPLLDGSVSLAAVNAPDSCAVAGPFDAISDLSQKIDALGIVQRELRTSHAYHSWMMDAALEPFASALDRFELSIPQLPYVSNVTGSWIGASEATDKNYWCRQLRETVQFDDGLKLLLGEPGRIFLEVGPGRALQSFVCRRSIADNASSEAVSSFRPRWQDRSESTQLLDAVGRLWAAGADIDWPSLHDDKARRRIPLPTYPFERKRYWSIAPEKIRQLSRPDGSFPRSATEPEQATVGLDQDNRFNFPSWKRIPWKHVPSTFRWVLFNDQGGPGHALAVRLRGAGCEVVDVRAGVEFGHLDNTFTIDPTNYEHYLAVFTRIRQADAGGHLTVVHLWTESLVDVPATRDSVEHALTSGFHSLVHIARAVADSGLDVTRIGAVTRGTCNVSGEESINPVNATLQGLCRVISTEFPGIKSSIVDLGRQEPRNSDPEGLDSIVRAVSFDSDSECLALRNGHLWVPTYETLEVEDDAPDVFRANGVYVITGGLGGIGMVIAEYLTRKYHAAVALLNRSEFPDRKHWDDWTNRPGFDDVARNISSLKSMEVSGGKVLALTVDVTDMEQTRSAITRIEQTLGPINGVFHAAGVLNDGAMVLKSRADFDEVLAPKVLGTIVLHRLFKDRSIDFLMMMSSLGSLLGRFGQADYAAANCFQDAFAQAHAGSSPHVLAVNWPAWRGIGSAAAHFNSQSRSEEENTIDTDQGIQDLRVAAGLQIPQVLVSPRPIPQLLSTARNEKLPGPLYPAEPGLEPDKDTDDPLIFVSSVWRKVLGVEDVHESDAFSDLGGDSLGAIRVVSHIKERFRVHFSLEEILEARTVSAQAALISERLRKAPPPADETDRVHLAGTGN